MHKLETALITIEQLLQKYGNRGHADYVGTCREKLLREGASAYCDLATLEWWGGSGSVADVLLYKHGEPASIEQKQDNRQLQLELLNIYDFMEANGVRMDRASRWAATFRKWTKKST